ncbi:MAG: IS66 family transposase [Acidobacteria bacterium]|nr:MAG: IS66 family transposase [Acidobacteriota bacterium]
MKRASEVIEVNFEELAKLRERARQGPLDEEDGQRLDAAIQALHYLIERIGEKDTTISQLRALLAKPTTEKTSKVLEQAGIKVPPQNPPPPKVKDPPKPGHGRNGAKAYGGAERIKITHSLLKPGDESAAAMIGLLRYGSGVPWCRLERLEASLGIPLPASTQCEIVAEVAEVIRPAFEELIRQAAQGEVFYNDDTSMKILALARASPQRAEEKESLGSKERTGLFTSGIVSTREGRRIALFFTGRKHAGENFARVLAERDEGLPSPIQMSDALSRNVPKLEEKLEILWGNCNAHARRRFVEVTPNFPQECRFVLESLRDVYRYDAEAEARGLSPEARLRFHQQHSEPVMTQLHAWFEAQFKEKKVEPNSGLGEAITYCLKRWDRLTLFLREAGAPLDSNIVERALKKAILHRKNSLFYKTENGAEVGDLFMSLIHTCELNGANPFDYLTELQKHAEELAANPAAWMPWNYRPTLQQPGTSKDPA